MSVSSRSPKAVMYSEIERLRALLDQRDLQIATQAETIRRRDAEIERLRAPATPPRPEPAPRPAPERSDRGTRNLMMKRLAITCKASVKWVDGQGFRQYKDGRWVGIPTHTVEFIAKGIGQ